MSIGTVLWNITEYATYLCIIIQTALMVMGYASKGLQGATADEGMNQILQNLGNLVKGLLPPPPRKGSSPASHRGRK